LEQINDEHGADYRQLADMERNKRMTDIEAADQRDRCTAMIKNTPDKYVKRSDLGPKRQKRRPVRKPREKDFLVAPIDEAGYINFKPTLSGANK
jgi:hypothetical protein